MTMRLPSRHISFLLPVLFALAGFFSCAREEVVEDVTGEAIPVAFSLGNGQQETKTIDAISQIDESFRGIESPLLIPFARRGKVLVTDEPLGKCSDLSDITSLNDVNHSRLYNNIYVPSSTASFLFYGAAVDQGSVSGIDDATIARKKRNGSLIVTGLEERIPAGITFSPDPFVSDATALEASQQAIVDVLNSLMSVEIQFYYRESNTWKTGTAGVTWTESLGSDTNLQNWFVQLTNDREVISGAGVALEKILTDIYNKLSSWTYNGSDKNTNVPTTLTNGKQAYYTNASGTGTGYYMKYSHYYQRFRDAVLAKIDAVATKTGSSGNYTLTLRSSAMKDFPGTYGLPDGAVAVIYDGTSFVIADSATGDARMPVGQFCYPAQLWYYCNSRIKTTTNDSRTYSWFNTNYYSNSSTWDAILSQYENDDAVVTSNVKGLVIKDPIQYGTALLQVTLGGVTSTLYDSDTGANRKSFTIGASDTQFPFEGLIIGGQRKQGFDFSPIDVDDHFIYDTDFGGTYYLRSSSVGPVRTSVLPSSEGESVRVAIELRNNSGVQFKGASGYIMPGYKFYLIGEIEYDTNASYPSGMNAVFMSDHITEATLMINSLAKAYNTIPDLRDPQLQLGVTARIDWVLSTPEERILY